MTGNGERIACIIQGCKRTAPKSKYPDTREIICGKHWRSVDQRLRDAHKRAQARIRKVIRLARRKAIRARGDARIDRLWGKLCAKENQTWQAVQADAEIKAAFGVEGAHNGRRKR